MSWHIRPAVRENTPLIIGIAGPTKSGKTYSAHRVAIGLKTGLNAAGPIVMLNAEGARGHQYAERFAYHGCDITPPLRPERYDEAIQEIAKLTPAVIIIDSASHMHDGPGGILEYHDEELERLSRGATNDRERAKYNFTAWIKPKAAENAFIYTMLGLSCPVILCFRAKEKLKIVPGQQPIDLGWQPIAGERIAFETLFTVTLPPHCKGVPDLEISDLREPFDTLIPKGKALDEDLGRKLAEWSRGPAKIYTKTGAMAAAINDELLTAITEELVKQGLNGADDESKKRRGDALEGALGTRSWKAIELLAPEQLRAGLVKLQVSPPATTSGTAVVPSGSTPVTVASTPAEQPGLALAPPSASTEERAPWDADDPSPIDGGRRDEATGAGLITAIEAEVRKWPKVPPRPMLDAIYAGFLEGQADLTKASPPALQTMLDFFRLYTAKDKDAQAKVNGFARNARATA